MDTNKEAKKYLNKYFKAQYPKETDDEYKSLVRLLNKALRIHDIVGQSEQLPQIHGLTKCECGKVYDVDIENNCPSCGN